MAEVQMEKPFAQQIEFAASIDAKLQRGTSAYRSLSKAMSEEAKPFLRPNSRIVDLNAKGGIWLEPLLAESSFRCRFIALNATEAENQECMDRFRMEVHLGFVQEMTRDLCEGVPPITADLTICALALTEKTIVCKKKVLKGIHKHTQKGGALLFVERLTEEEDWEAELKEAGFSEVRQIWSSNMHRSWLARR